MNLPMNHLHILIDWLIFDYRLFIIVFLLNHALVIKDLETLVLELFELFEAKDHINEFAAFFLSWIILTKDIDEP
jgi:hypothetical protein